MNFIFFLLKVIISILFLVVNLSAQDSLYLIGTIQGVNLDEPIFNIQKAGDINGDGFDDFITTIPKSNYCNIYLGSNSFDLNPDIILKNPIGIYDFGFFLGDVGDVNKDGYDDFIIQGKYDSLFFKGQVFLYLGKEIIDSKPDFTFHDYFIQDALGASISGGDINGDGYSDFIIGNPYNWTNGIGRAYLFIGGETIIDTPNIAFIGNSSEDFYGDCVSIEGDINGDGFNDILISAPNILDVFNSCAKVNIYYGSISFSNTTDTIITSAPNYSFNIGSDENAKIVGDVNNDGFDDFFTSGGSLNPKLYFGSENLSENNYIEFSAYKEIDNFGIGFGGIGDINNDGFDDFAINIENFINSNNIMVSKLNIYLGSSVIDTIPDFSLVGETKWGNFGRIIGNCGDLNGDSYNEFYVLAPNYPDYENPLGKVYIYSMKNFIVGVKKENKSMIPKSFSLFQNYPNPFNPTTIVNYSIPESAFVTLSVFNSLGEIVSKLISKEHATGNYSVTFNAENLSSGIYFYRITANNFVQTKKMVLLR